VLGDYVAAPDGRRPHGHRARVVATERFSLPAMVASYQRVYEELAR
jgi:hypothetical protein